MLKKIYTCDCFLDLAAYCLETNADFDCFRSLCVKQMKRKDIFIIHDVERRSTVFSPIKLVDCCKNFVNFQIDFYVKTDSFPLKSVVCNYTWARAEADDCADFDYRDIFVESYYNSDDDSDFNNSSTDDDDDHRQTNCFVSSLCFCKMRTCLKFTRFCLKCRNSFLRFFMQKMHLLEKNTVLV